eukprot:g8020.t1
MGRPPWNAPTLNKGQPVAMGRHTALHHSSSTSVAGHSAKGAAAEAAETLKDRDLRFDNRHILTFRVTGAASVARLEPLLLNHNRRSRRQAVWRRAVSSGEGGGNSSPAAASAQLDFVWETTVTKDQHEQHRSARVLNRLSGAQVLEDKANLVLLQRLMTAPTLESYVAPGAKTVAEWAQSRFQQRNTPPDVARMPPSAPPERVVVDLDRTSGYDGTTTRDARAATTTVMVPETVPAEVAKAAAAEVGDGGAGGEDWWCVKAAGGNGGLDIWVLHEGNWKSVTEQLSGDESYVIQRYVARPLLWHGRKFHFRVYALLRADMSAWLYRTAYILSASRPYSLGNTTNGGANSAAEFEGAPGTGFADELVHISNLAVNKHTAGHPGQVPCDLPSDYPDLWPGMLELLRSLVQAATPFMEHQANPNHFEFLGLDIIADRAGGVWLMEANRLPGLQSSKQNLEEENQVYDDMMQGILQLLVLPALTGCPPEPGKFEAAASPASSATAPSTETWRNEDEEESEEETEEDSSSDDSYDYGFDVGNDEDGEGSDYEVDYAAMNVSPEILRMLGASEEQIAAKEAEVAAVASTWVPPTETGLANSAAIADSAAVALGAGEVPAETEVKRVFRAVGAFDNEVGAKDSAAPAGPGDTPPPVLKVKIVHAPEPVPKKYESKLPPASEHEDGGSDDSDDSDDSDGSWDEASVIDGRGWWETGSNDDEELVSASVSPNLRSILGLANPPEDSGATTGEGEEVGSRGWRPPSFAGLGNSKPLTTLQPLVVGQNNTGLQVEYRKGAPGDDGQDREDGDEWSEEEGWDYEGGLTEAGQEGLEIRMIGVSCSFLRSTRAGVCAVRAGYSTVYWQNTWCPEHRLQDWASLIAGQLLCAMTITELAPRENDSEEEEEESEEESGDDESYDYGFADEDDEDGEDSDYEVDYAAMNVSPEILRMLGASEEEIAAKEAEVAGVTSTWVPPTETGLEHSAAIADSAAVALGAGEVPAGTEVKRVFKAVGAFDNEVGAGDSAAPAAPGDTPPPVLKVKVSHAPEPVPKKYESKLPPASEHEDGGPDSDDDSDGSWDETSVIDGHAWWETGSNDDEELVTTSMSANLRSTLGLAKPPEESGATTGERGEAGDNDWRPPSFSGLGNSNPLTTLQPLVVGQNNTGLQVEYRKGAPGNDGQDGEDGDEWSEEEGWDYEGWGPTMASCRTTVSARANVQ